MEPDNQSPGMLVARLDRIPIWSLPGLFIGIIGGAAARQFIKEGAKVIVTGRGTQSVGDAQKELGANGVTVAAAVY